jgi:hypothetical protein
MIVYHGTAASERLSIVSSGLAAGTHVTARRDLATGTYAVYAAARNSAPTGGLLVVLDVLRSELEPDPRSDPEEQSYRLRRRVFPARVLAVEVHRAAVAEVRGFAHEAAAAGVHCTYE